MDRRAWYSTWGCKELDMTERLTLNSEPFEDRDHILIIYVTSGHGTQFCSP